MKDANSSLKLESRNDSLYFYDIEMKMVVLQIMGQRELLFVTSPDHPKARTKIKKGYRISKERKTSTDGETTIKKVLL